MCELTSLAVGRQEHCFEVQESTPYCWINSTDLTRHESTAAICEQASPSLYMNKEMYSYHYWFHSYPAMHVQWAANTSPFSAAITQGNSEVANIRWECFTYVY